MKKLSLAVKLVLLTVFSTSLNADELSWLSPSNTLFKNIPVTDRIIPLGFSKKSVFSYLLQENSCNQSSINGQKIYWIAVDLVKDTILETIILGNEAPEDSAIDVMQKYGNVIRDFNSQYEIVSNNSHQISTSPTIKSKNDVLTIKLELVETIYGEDAINPGYKKYKILLSSKSRGSKTLAKIKSVYNPLHYWGYIKSPFEERIAGLFLSTFRGCEAFPQMRINIVGANLLHRFKKNE